MNSVRVMTFNLRRDVEADGENAWRHRRDVAAQLVRDEAPDVLGTQEGLAHMLADLDARLPGYARVGGCREGDGSDEACAIYYRADRFTVEAWGDWWLSDTPEVTGSRTWGNRHPRIVTWVKLRDLATGAQLSVANTHFDHESEKARELAARMIAERLPDAVLMGDFNAHPGDAPHTFLLDAGWTDAHTAHDEPDDPAYTFHGFTGEALMRIDWILAPRTHRVRSHRVPVREGPRHPSDHHPIVVEIEPAALR